MLRHCLVWASDVVVGSVFAAYSPHMRFIENEQFVKTFVADRSGPPLGECAGVGSPHRGMDTCIDSAEKIVMTMMAVQP